MTAHLLHHLRIFAWTTFYRATTPLFFASVGAGAIFEGWIDIPQRDGRITLGHNVRIGRGVEFSVLAGAELIIGDDVFIGRGTIISAHRHVGIGANTLISENVSIHDNNHVYLDPGLPIHCQGFEAEPLDVADDCWIGAHAVLVKGCGLGHRCVLGAGAVLTDKLGDYITAVGTPARPMAQYGYASNSKKSYPSNSHHPGVASPVPDEKEKEYLSRHGTAGTERPVQSGSGLKLESRTACPLCASPHFQTAVDFRDIPVLRCNACGFLYSSRVMSEDKMTSYYREDFASERHRRGQQLNAETNFRALSQWQQSKPGLSVLDVGCGYGFLLSELRHRWQADVTGVEISRNESSFAERQLGLTSIYPTLDDLPPDRTYDLVTCFEVIEHIRDPLAFTHTLLEKVAPGGTLLILTDNFASRAVREMGCAFPKWIPHAHISHFTKPTLENCLRRAGAGDVSFYSYTPWEIWALAAKKRLSPARAAAACYSLEKVLAAEMNQPFRLFALRKWLNKIWIPLALKPNENGSLLYAVAHP